MAGANEKTRVTRNKFFHLNLKIISLGLAPHPWHDGIRFCHHLHGFAIPPISFGHSHPKP